MSIEGCSLTLRDLSRGQVLHERQGTNMADVRDVLVYFFTHYPKRGDLSIARLTRMVYLADWRSAILYRKQITPLEWQYGDYGLEAPGIMDCISSDRRAFELVSTQAAPGQE